ncbi:MAG: dolichol-phosphate mannosyltransferase [Deltaproteobacteria bacterium]|nr:dolichol-phosphate mannosyltransferase [Deltaproteobacteria bacterium]
MDEMITEELRDSVSVSSQLDFSIVSSARNEQENIRGMVRDIESALKDEDFDFEMILIDDASTDQTASVMKEQEALNSWLRCDFISPCSTRDRNGQSAAFYHGIRLSRSSVIVLMDADRQNDPRDIPEMFQILKDTRAQMVQGDRTAHREDNYVRRMTSVVGRISRRVFLGDTIRDTGCSLRVFERELGLLLPLEISGMHRFIPFCARALGFNVVEVPVRHHPRIAGKPKYGVFNRFFPGILGLVQVRRMRRHLRNAKESRVG